MAIQTKAYLCSAFSNSCVPTQQNFYDLIDSSDGVYQCVTTLAMVPKYRKGVTANVSGTQTVDIQVISDTTQVACTACSTIVGGGYSKICTSSTGATYGGVFSANCSCVCSTSTQNRQVIFGGCCNVANNSTGAFFAGGSYNCSSIDTGSPHYIIGGCRNSTGGLSVRGLVFGGACNSQFTACSVLFGGCCNYGCTTRNLHFFGGCFNCMAGLNITGNRIGGYYNYGNSGNLLTMGCCNCLTFSGCASSCGMAFGGCNTPQRYAFTAGVCNLGHGDIIGVFLFGCRTCLSGNNQGQFIWGSSSFTTAQGEAMSGFLHLRRQTTDATVTYLTTNNSASTINNRFFIDSGTAYAVTVILSAYRTGGAAGGNVGDSGVWIIHGVVKNVGGTTTLVGQSTDYSYSQDAGWAVTLVGNNTNDSLEVQITGVVSENINWSARVDFVKVKS